VRRDVRRDAVIVAVAVIVSMVMTSAVTVFMIVATTVAVAVVAPVRVITAVVAPRLPRRVARLRRAVVRAPPRRDFARAAVSVEVPGRSALFAAAESGETHARFRRGQAAALHALESERPTVDRQRAQAALDFGRVRAEIGERAEQHVAGGTAKRVDDEDLHGRGL
jgi:hypothetical protein